MVVYKSAPFFNNFINTIFVKSGLYIENIIIDVEELSLIGENKFNTVIDADKNTKDAVNILAPNVTIQDFTITNAHSNTRAPWDQSGMKIYSSNVIVQNNMFVSTSGNYLEPAFMCTKEAMGVDRILLGTDYPMEDPGECMQFLEGLPISEEEKGRIYGGNARQVGVMI